MAGSEVTMSDGDWIESRVRDLPVEWKCSWRDKSSSASIAQRAINALSLGSTAVVIMGSSARLRLDPHQRRTGRVEAHAPKGCGFQLIAPLGGSTPPPSRPIQE